MPRNVKKSKNVSHLKTHPLVKQGCPLWFNLLSFAKFTSKKAPGVICPVNYVIITQCSGQEAFHSPYLFSDAADFFLQRRPCSLDFFYHLAHLSYRKELLDVPKDWY